MTEGISLFVPKNDKDLRRQYPELSEVPEFKALSSSEMMFVWWYANITSPLNATEIDDKEKAIQAYEKSFKKTTDKVAYENLNFPERVRVAIERMIRFSPGARTRAKSIVEEMMKNFEDMVKVDMNEFKVADKEGNISIDWTGRNSYVNSCAKISDTLPRLISQMEEGFGVVNQKGEELKGIKAIDKFHSTKKEF
jgi:hypothetical protein